MKYTILIIMLLLAVPAMAQQYSTRTGRISFFSETPVENIEAVSNQAAGMLDASSGKFNVQMLIKSFRFKKRLMEEHFNENYMESDRYPKAVFDGQITNIDQADLTRDGSYPVTAKGVLTMHGVSRDVAVPGKLTVADGKITATATFIAKPADYKIKIPSLVRKNIAEEISVTVNLVLHEK